MPAFARYIGIDYSGAQTPTVIGFKVIGTNPVARRFFADSA